MIEVSLRASTNARSAPFGPRRWSCPRTSSKLFGRRFKSRKAGYATARWTKRGFAVKGSGLGAPADRLEVAVADGRIASRVVWSRPLPSAPTSVSVHRNGAERWWASFVVRVEVPDAPLFPTGRATGLDVGLRRAA
jgi:putative transposase